MADEGAKPIKTWRIRAGYRAAGGKTDLSVSFLAKSACGLPELTLEPPLPETQRCRRGAADGDRRERRDLEAKLEFRDMDGGAR